jgi:TPR repeat protein
LCVCLTGLCLSACFPVPTVAPAPDITALKWNLDQVARPNANSAQDFADLARSFSSGYGGVGKDPQASTRLLYAAADRGSTKAQVSLASNYKVLPPNTTVADAPTNVSSPDELMEAAYWLYQLAQKGDRVHMGRLSALYARPDFPAYDLVESCKWRLLARQACDSQHYSAEIFLEASKRAQPLFSQFPK